MRMIINHPPKRGRGGTNLLAINQASLGKTYLIAGFHPSLMQDSHLRNLGVVMGAPIKLITLQDNGGIVTIHQTKLALDQNILEKILVTEDDSAKKIALAELKPGQTATIATVLGAGAVKRRLLDMGLTKGTTLLLRKVAPLGDPVEINVRGYELTLRKQEAELVMCWEEAE